jgi:hypothetical protein
LKNCKFSEKPKFLENTQKSSSFLQKNCLENSTFLKLKKNQNKSPKKGTFSGNFSCKSAFLLNFSKVHKKPQKVTFLAFFLQKCIFAELLKSSEKSPKKGTFSGNFPSKTAFLLNFSKVHKKATKKALFL